MIRSETIAKFQSALPFWLSFLLIPALWLSVLWGGWWLALAPLITWHLFTALDAVTGLNFENADLETDSAQLKWYKRLTILWVPAQFLALFGLIAYVPNAAHLNGFEKFAAFFGVGVMTGTIGINYAHELMHQQSKLERWFGDILLAMTLYSHFRSEHLLVHHRYVGTPRDTVTARYNEGFHSYFPRVLKQTYVSAFRAEKEMLARKDLPWTDKSNPFFRFWALQGGFLLLALILGGPLGVALFLWQSFIAVWQLELVNYVEHYGLTRKYLGRGKYEHVAPRHSWNAAHKATNWLLINLQRHSDHHYKPDRRFPLLQNYTEADAPQLPYGYPLMTMAAMYPRLWRRIMNPRVQRWRDMYYPEITNWRRYNKASNPMPR